MDRSVRLLSEFYRTPWALEPCQLAAFQAIVCRWAEGGKLSAAEITDAIGDRPEVQAARRDRERQAGGSMIAVLPVFGVIGHRANLVEGVSTGVNTSTEILVKQFRSLVADPAVGAIVLDIDSPGGSVFGVAELADEIVAARATKPIKAVANSYAASAAYWIGSAADELIVVPGGQAGSIGVWSAHEDWSKFLEKKGVATTLISAGKFKVEGHPYAPLDAVAQASMQDQVDKYYSMFTGAVAKHRGVKQAAVKEGFGQGRMLLDHDAVAAGLADRVATFDQVIADLGKGMAKQRGGSSATSIAQRRAEISALG